jgi:hypothetical protein
MAKKTSQTAKKRKADPNNTDDEDRSASRENSFSRSFRTKVINWHKNEKDRLLKTENGQLPDPADLRDELGGPSLRDVCGFMLSLKDQNEANIGDNATGRAWKAWKEAHPEATEMMMRFLSEVETDDGRRITLEDYTPPKKSRLRLVIKSPEDEDGNPARSVAAKSMCV